MLPPPTLTFTIPSIHDDTVLDCRIYHPTALSSPGWKKKAAIVAHPYAPLGGCYDDPVLDIVGGVILKCGFVLGTFNFRYDLSIEIDRISWLMNRQTEVQETPKAGLRGQQDRRKMIISVSWDS